MPLAILFKRREITTLQADFGSRKYRFGTDGDGERYVGETEWHGKVERGEVGALEMQKSELNALAKGTSRRKWKHFEKLDHMQALHPRLC